MIALLKIRTVKLVERCFLEFPLIDSVEWESPWFKFCAKLVNFEVLLPGLAGVVPTEIKTLWGATF